MNNNASTAGLSVDEGQAKSLSAEERLYALLCDAEEWELRCVEGVPWRSLGSDLLAFAKADAAACHDVGKTLIEEGWCAPPGSRSLTVEVGRVTLALAAWVACEDFLGGAYVDSTLVKGWAGKPRLLLPNGSEPSKSERSDEWEGALSLLVNGGWHMNHQGQAIGPLMECLSEKWGIDGQSERSPLSPEVLARAFAKAFLAFGVGHGDLSVPPRRVRL